MSEKEEEAKRGRERLELNFSWLLRRLTWQ